MSSYSSELAPATGSESDSDAASAAPGPAPDSLQSWYHQYSQTLTSHHDPEWASIGSAIAKGVESDTLDYDLIESQVQQLATTTHVSQGFCTNCQHLLDHWPNMDDASRWGTRGENGLFQDQVANFPSTDRIEAAARAGCMLCAFTLSTLRMQSHLDLFRKIESRMRKLGLNVFISFTIRKATRAQYFPYVQDSGAFGLSMNYPTSFDTNQGYLEMAYVMGSTRVLAPTAKLRPESTDPFTVAKTWLARCSNLHTACRSTVPHRKPTRLVSIGNGQIKLTLTTDWRTAPRYATLSYCWGSQPFTMLTQGNLGRFLRNIPAVELPETFRDAIETARKLEIDFIWIDALCIIQNGDDNDDWAKEAGLMASVYGGGFVNLAVSTATNVYQGFPHVPQDFRSGFVARLATSMSCTVQAFQQEQAYEKSTIESHLASRAWAFQEKLLSPRTIHFGDSGLFWECRDHVSSQFLSDGEPSMFAQRSLVQTEGRPWDWFEIVEHYTRADLTYREDRLPALSGIAARQRLVTGDCYLAGMWDKSLVHELLWHVHGMRSHRPPWRAPTWSWASIDGKVDYSDYIAWSSAYLSKEYIEVLKVWTTLAGPDRHGAVTGGSLVLSCTHMLRGHISEDSYVDQNSFLWCEIGPDADEFDIEIDCIEDTLVSEGGVVYLLPVMERRFDVEFVECEVMLQGLVLRACDNFKGVFERVGIFNFSYEDESAHEWDTLKLILEKFGPSTIAAECSSILEQGEEHKYVITIN